MTIDKNRYEVIIKSLRLGNSIAEHDNILQEARVTTPTFEGVVNDKYDIVTGRKGAGKTAIFKIVSDELRPYYLASRSTVILSGVNSSGESIFSQFKSEFAKFTEEDFENFWKLYFISLIYNHFIKNPEFESSLEDCRSEIEAFKRACHLAGIPDIPAQHDRSDMIKWIINIFSKVKKVKGSAALDSSNPNLVLFNVEVEAKDEQEERQTTQKSIYVNKIGLSLRDVLQSSGYKMWIVLDRLDEVFERYSMIEFNGLRGLLRAYKSFNILENGDLFRVKIFLRDDIKEFLTDDKAFKKFYPKNEVPPLVAATHIFAKESPVLSWTQEEIEQLILFRLLLSDELKDFLGIKVKDRDELEEKLRSREVRSECWNKIFPSKIINSSSLDWMYRRLRDSNGVVTPRSVIDMLTAATDFQKKNIRVNFEDAPHIFPIEAIKAGIDTASRNKLEKDIYNEFPKDQQYIKELGKYGKHKLNSKDLQKLYGKDWEKIADNLSQIGILRFIKHSNDYMVEFLFRPALNITYKY
jgi:hypothetical protein